MTTSTPYDIDPRTVPHRIALIARDEAIMQALAEHFTTGGLMPRATALAAALEAYRATVYWPTRPHCCEPPAGTSPRNRALHRILYLGRGHAPGAHDIRSVAERARRAAA
jgi:hypothetical protein